MESGAFPARATPIRPPAILVVTTGFDSRQRGQDRIATPTATVIHIASRHSQLVKYARIR